MELVTGHSGTPHVSAADVATMLRGAYGSTDCVLTVDDELDCTILSANQAQIGAGGCMLQGHFCRVDVAETLTVESGQPGYNRNDLIVARYTLGSENVQSVSLVVVKGTPTTGTAADPSVTEGDIDGGDTTADFVLWRIPITGVNVGTPVRVLPVAATMQESQQAIADNAADIATIQDSLSPISQKVAKIIFTNVGSVEFSKDNNNEVTIKLGNGYSTGFWFVIDWANSRLAVLHSGQWRTTPFS